MTDFLCTKGIRAAVENETDQGVFRTPISARTQAANDAHALAIIQWHTADRFEVARWRPEVLA